MTEKAVGHKTLEEKIDLLQQHLNKVEQERQNERMISKLDGFYNVFITIATFSIGLIVSQRIYFSTDISSIILFLLISIVLSMIVSFIKGINGMIKNILIHRILSWGLLFSAFISFLAGIVYAIASSVLMRFNIGTEPYLSIGFISFFFLNFLLISPLFMRRFGRRLAYLAGEDLRIGKGVNTQEFEALKNKIESGEADKSVVSYVVNTAYERNRPLRHELNAAISSIINYNLLITFAAFGLTILAYFLGFVPMSVP
jgi:hypothetical protein